MDESQPVTDKRSYDAALKLKVVEYAEDNSNRAAAREHNMDEITVHDCMEYIAQMVEICIALGHAILAADGSGAEE